MSAEIVETEMVLEVTQPSVGDERFYELSECNLGASAGLMGGELKLGKVTLSAEEAYQVTAFCGKCVVRSDCLADALILGDKYGIRGGLNGAQRKPLASMLKKQGFIDESTWDTAVGRAEEVRRRFLEERPREWQVGFKQARPVTTEQAVAMVEELLGSDDSRLFSVPDGTRFYEVMGEQLGISPDKVKSSIGQLACEGRVEKTFQQGRRGRPQIGSLRLVS